ncbi:MAG TPA: hypothetical protein VFW05_02300 [Verrucomicrobiae bacterium]|nr:hypothetical protein [Verrucomicrobiae bacterium]
MNPKQNTTKANEPLIFQNQLRDRFMSFSLSSRATELIGIAVASNNRPLFNHFAACECVSPIHSRLPMSQLGHHLLLSSIFPTIVTVHS